MADYFYACYDFDLPLPPRPAQVEASAARPWRARLASCWALRPEWGHRLHEGFLAISVKVFAIKGIIRKVDVRQKHALAGDGLLLDLQMLFPQITTHTDTVIKGSTKVRE